MLGLPRRRGGLPPLGLSAVDAKRFAPQTRGSTPSCHKRDYPSVVCPADAGVYPLPSRYSRVRPGLPRRRGGLPRSARTGSPGCMFAPQTRGSTSCPLGQDRRTYVCPADAGVYRCPPVASQAPGCLPRRRGGLPRWQDWEGYKGEFAPQTRGSTAKRKRKSGDYKVCPADAGVYRRRLGESGNDTGLPRRRGGLPHRSASKSGGN